MFGVRLILVGDLAQFSAVMDSWLSAPIREDALGCSDMLREMVGV